MPNEKVFSRAYESAEEKQADQSDRPRPDIGAVPIVESAPKKITQYGDKRRSYFRKRDYGA